MFASPSEGDDNRRALLTGNCESACRRLWLELESAPVRPMQTNSTSITNVRYARALTAAPAILSIATRPPVIAPSYSGTIATMYAPVTDAPFLAAPLTSCTVSRSHDPPTRGRARLAVRCAGAGAADR